MVKKIALFLTYVLLLLLAIVYFAPKENLYYLVEQKLQPYNIVISDEKIKDSGFVLHLKDADIYVESVKSAKVASADISTFLLFNSINIKGVMLDEFSQGFMPRKINEVYVYQSIFDPLHIHVRAVGDFGEVSAKVGIVSRQIKAILKPSQLMLQKYQNSLRVFVKDQEGEYVYEKNI